MALLVNKKKLTILKNLARTKSCSLCRCVTGEEKKSQQHWHLSSVTQWRSTLSVLPSRWRSELCDRSEPRSRDRTCTQPIKHSGSLFYKALDITVAAVIWCCIGAHRYVCLSACLLVCLSACLLVCLSVCLFVCLSVCLSFCPFICQYNCMINYPSISLHFCPSICLSSCLSILLSFLPIRQLFVCSSILVDFVRPSISYFIIITVSPSICLLVHLPDCLFISSAVRPSVFCDSVWLSYKSQK